MPFLSITQLDTLPTFDVTPEVVANGHNLSYEQVWDRWSVALHEAAHFVAICACRGSYIRVVNIPYKGPRFGSGGISAIEVHAIETCFATMAGFVWECLYGDPWLGRFDLRDIEESEYARLEGGDLFRLHEWTEDFLETHLPLIEHVAAGLVGLCNKEGVLEGTSLKALDRWTRARVHPFTAYAKNDQPKTL